MKVRFTLEALAHLADIRSYIAAKSPSAANRVAQRIFSECDRLEQFPQLGHAGIVQGTYEWTVPGLPFVVVYELQPKR